MGCNGPIEGYTVMDRVVAVAIGLIYAVGLGGLLLASMGGTAIETHHYQITDLSTGKVYVAEKNNVTSDQKESRDCYRHLFDAGCTFTLHDGTWVEIDSSVSWKQID